MSTATDEANKLFALLKAEASGPAELASAVREATGQLMQRLSEYEVKAGSAQGAFAAANKEQYEQFFKQYTAD